MLVLCQSNSKPSWPESEIFSDEMFGSAMGDPDNLYQINSGWFKDVTSLYDPDLDFELDFIDPGHNAFGFIDAQFNYQSLRGIARTNSYCGLKGEMEFATCNTLIGCFDNDNIYDWTICMEDQVTCCGSTIIHDDGRYQAIPDRTIQYLQHVVSSYPAKLKIRQSRPNSHVAQFSTARSTA